MISARLQGGLGNQLFQIATATALAWRNGDNAIFDFESCYTPLQGKPATNYRENIFRNIKEGTFEPEAYYKEPSHEFRPIPYQKGLLIDGYYQSERYFSDVLDKIQDLFVLEDFRVEVGDITAIHVRRGDYQKNPGIFPLCTLEYYQNAIDMIGGKFMVFSDDPDWCKENIKGNNIKHSGYKTDVLDLSIMASCKNIIGSNSSFALWAYFLNRNKDKVGIFPKVWFGPEGPSQETMHPQGVIKL